MRTILRFICNEFVLIAYLVVLFILLALKPGYIRQFPDFIDWRTIASLSGLIVITTGFRISGYFDAFARHSLRRISTERNLFVTLVGLTAFLSTFLTNDVALFLVVPLTLSYSRILENDLGKLIIFEAIAANAGSSISPIGNPQNIFIYRFRDIPFHEFILKMFPVATVMMVLLLVLVVFVTPGEQLKIRSQVDDGKKDNRLFWISLVLFVGFIVAMELNVEVYSVYAVIFVFLLYNRNVLRESNWLLLFLFVVFFLVSSMLSREEWIRTFVESLRPDSDFRIFSISVVASQIMSNVPAAILVSHFTERWVPLAYGVNVGGNGLVIASLANIIAIRLSGRRDLWLKFHIYSIPMLLISMFVVQFIIPIFK